MEKQEHARPAIHFERITARTVRQKDKVEPFIFIANKFEGLLQGRTPDSSIGLSAGPTGFRWKRITLPPNERARKEKMAYKLLQGDQRFLQVQITRGA